MALDVSASLVVMVVTPSATVTDSATYMAGNDEGHTTNVSPFSIFVAALLIVTTSFSSTLA